MNRKYLRLKSIAIILITSVLHIEFKDKSQPEYKHSEEGNEERPDQPLMSNAESELFKKYLEKRQNQIHLKSLPAWSESSYANGKIQGTWVPKIPLSGWFGYRVDNSAYDSLNDIFYVVTYAGHLYKLEYRDTISWTLLNHKIVMNPPSNSSPNPIFTGTLLADSTYRLIRSNDDAFRMEYSDDEGKTWQISTGANISQSTSNQIFEITNNKKKRIVLHTYYGNYHHIYFSDDNGETYTASKHSISISNSDVRIAKPYYTNEAFMWLWSKSTKKIDIYQYDTITKDFELKINSSSTLEGSNLSSAEASYFNGKYHFYLATINSGYAVYYSSDTGTTWVQKNSGHDRPFEVMCPDKPNILISGFEDMKLSDDYGTTWNGYSWKLGWDLQHLRTFEMKNGKHITLAGLDFGCYVSETPEDKESYIWCNNGASYGMHYDAVTSEKYESIYMANQDRGATAYPDTGMVIKTVDVDGTDVLRVCTANREKGVWTWFYYGRIKHRYNFPTGKSENANFDGLGNWWAAPIVASPNPSEDAIYAAYGNNLQKFIYNEESNSISKTAHHFDFKSNFGDELGGFGYSDINRKIWYAALNNGVFVYSIDGGQTWTKSLYNGTKPRANDQSYNYNKNQIVIKASAIKEYKVYYAGVGNVFLISDDGGRTFINRNKGLNIYRIRDFALSPDEKYIFAACGYGGAWVYSVDDDYWYQMSDDPVPSVDFTDVQFIKNKNCVRFSTFGSGILDLVLNNNFFPINEPKELTVAWDSANSVILNWADNSTDEDGFYIERESDIGIERIGTVSANTTSYTDNSIDYNNVYFYNIIAFKNEDISLKSNTVQVYNPEEGFIGKEGWKIISVSSEDTIGNYNPAKYVYDNNKSTFWLTNISGSHPHHIAIDLGKEIDVEGFRYLARQDENPLGNISLYEFHITNDTSDWGSPVKSSILSNRSEWQEIIFDQMHTGRYIKFVAVSEIGGGNYASAAEISLLYKAMVPNSPVDFDARLENINDSRLIWKDNSINDQGFIVEQLIENEFTIIDSIRFTKSNYLLKNLEPGSYTFRMRSYNKTGLSAPTEAIENVLLPPLPYAPIYFTAIEKNNSSVQLSWQDTSQYVSGFIIEQYIDTGYIAIDTVEYSVKTYLAINTEPGNTYKYRLRTYNNAGTSEPGSEVVISTSTVGINEIQKPDWKIHLKGESEMLTIELIQFQKPGIINLIDLNGKTVLTKQTDSGNSLLNLPVNSIPKGFYIVELRSGGVHKTQKISIR